MSGNDLRAECERLARRIADAMANKPAAEAWELLEQLGSLTQQCVERIVEAEAQIAELKRELFGPESDRLSPQQEDQLKQVIDDMKAEAERAAPDSDQVLSEEEESSKRKPRKPASRRRHPMPGASGDRNHTIEPDLTPCPGCGKMPNRIGDEVTEEIDFIPARLIRRRMVRPKYACHCGEAGVAVAPLPPRLIPHSKLGLGLAMHIVLTRFDDHLSFYRLEQQFREHHAVDIPRQQMVQWIEHIANWLEPLVDTLSDHVALGYPEAARN